MAWPVQPTTSRRILAAGASVRRACARTTSRRSRPDHVVLGGVAVLTGDTHADTGPPRCGGLRLGRSSPSPRRSGLRSAAHGRGRDARIRRPRNNSPSRGKASGRRWVGRGRRADLLARAPPSQHRGRRDLDHRAVLEQRGHLDQAIAGYCLPNSGRGSLSTRSACDGRCSRFSGRVPSDARARSRASPPWSPERGYAPPPPRSRPATAPR